MTKKDLQMRLDALGCAWKAKDTKSELLQLLLSAQKAAKSRLVQTARDARALRRRQSGRHGG